MISTVLSLDFSLSLLTFQSYWLSVGGGEHLSGFAFGSYDLVGIIGAPLSGWMSDRIGMKSVFVFGLLFNIVGNIGYAFAGFFRSYYVLLSGRFVSGIGASVLGLTLAYVTKTVPGSEQLKIVGYLKYSSAFSRIIGPTLASFLVLSPTNYSSHQKMFDPSALLNLYTLPGWIAAVLGMVVLGLLVALFRSPESFDKRYEDIADPINSSIVVSPSKNDIYLNLGFVLAIQLIGAFAYWALGANLFLLAMVQYRIIHKHQDLWKLYITGIVAFTLAFAVFMPLKTRVSPHKIMFVGMLITLFGTLLFTPFISHPPASLFYLGIGFTTFGYALFTPGVNAVYSKLVKKHASLFGSFQDLIVSFISVSGSVARLSGPALFSWIVHLGQNQNCDVDKFQVHGCKLENVIPAIVFILALCTTALLFIGATYFRTLEPKNKTSTSV